MAQQIIAPAASRLLMTITMLLAFLHVACATGTLHLPGTYSSLTYSEEGNDLIGYEVRIIPTNLGTKAVVQVAEGDAGKIYIVDVMESSLDISFEIPLASGAKGRFMGRRTPKGLEGKITFPSGESEQVLLKRAPSYWDK